MTQLIKRALYNVLGRKLYLKAMQSGFLFGYGAGLLRKDPVYKFHYFVKEIIKPGDTVVDLGANLGYFSSIFAGLVGNNGRLISIEPVKPFFEILRSRVGKYPQATLYNYALGTEPGTIDMSVPNDAGFLRTGLAHITAHGDTPSAKDFHFTVDMVRGSDLLASLDRLDYLKCDIEGYEEVVLPEIRNIIAKFHPLVQLETWGKQRPVMLSLFDGLGYTPYILESGNLHPYDRTNTGYVGDFLFVHTSNKIRVEKFLAS